METENMIILIILSIPVGILLYFFLPKLYFIAGLKKQGSIYHNYLDSHLENILNKTPFAEKWKKIVLRKLDASGIGDNNTWIYWTLFTVLVPPFIFIIMLGRNYSFFVSLIVSISTILIPERWLSNRVREREEVFLKYNYKIYSFLHSQISSGIKATDAIRELHLIADHPLIKQGFVQFVARYELTMNIEESTCEIKKHFPGYDGEMLSVVINQCVNTGVAGRTLYKMENMMFSKYFNILQRETEKYKTRLLIIGIMGLLPIVIIMTSPIIYEAVKGFSDVLSG